MKEVLVWRKNAQVLLVHKITASDFVLTITNWITFWMTLMQITCAHTRGDLYSNFNCRKQNQNWPSTNKQWYRLAFKMHQAHLRGSWQSIWDPLDQRCSVYLDNLTNNDTLNNNFKLLVWSLCCHKCIRFNNIFRDQTTLRFITKCFPP